LAFPGTFLSIQDAVIAKLRLNATNDRPKAKDWINQAYAQVCIEEEITQTSSTAPLTPNVGSYTLTASIARVKEIVAAAVSAPSSYGPPLQAVSLDEINMLRQSASTTPTSSSTVAKYAMVGLNQLELWPTPANADVLLIYYVYFPTPLTADSDVPVLQEPWGSKILEYGALVEGAQLQKDPDLMYFENKYTDWLRRMRRHMNRRPGGPVQQLWLSRTPALSLARDVDTGE
jgi:hypothetical protein